MLRWWVLLSLPIVLVAFLLKQKQQQSQLLQSSSRWLDPVELWRASPHLPPMDSILTKRTTRSGADDTTNNLHLVVLVHGWMGNSHEMDYLQDQLTGDNDDTLLVHSAICNEGLTHDGIAMGGTRLAQEINTLLQHLTETKSSHISLSLVGNSLGGLYARYALSQIQWDYSNNGMRVTPNLFVTTCTPHLGVTQQTYLTLPRAVEYPIASVMRQTGRDLFRTAVDEKNENDVIAQMTYESEFVDPLRRFEERIAYVNVYATDFQVGTKTAAFWEFMSEDDPDNVATHYPIPENRDSTPPNEILLQLKTNQRDVNYKNLPLSVALDSMGWTKVLVDVRHHLPSIKTLLFSGTENNKGESEPLLSTRWKNKPSWKVNELLETFGTNHEGRFAKLPFGHTIAVANSKNAYYKQWNSGGRPIMDFLAKNIRQK